jgi:hypothetical protein
MTSAHSCGKGTLYVCVLCRDEKQEWPDPLAHLCVHGLEGTGTLMERRLTGKSSTWTALGLNQNFRGWNLASDHLKYGMAAPDTEVVIVLLIIEETGKFCTSDRFIMFISLCVVSGSSS